MNHPPTCNDDDDDDDDDDDSDRDIIINDTAQKYL
jgi:hypothetical protein